MAFGLLLLAACLGCIPAAIAQSKGRGFGGWWVYGALLLVVALPHALLLNRDQAELDRRAIGRGEARKCDQCAELVRHDAKVCRYCGAALPEIVAEPVSAIVSDAVVDEPAPVSTKKGWWIIAGVFFFVALAAVVINQANTTPSTPAVVPPPSPTLGVNLSPQENRNALKSCRRAMAATKGLPRAVRILGNHPIAESNGETGSVTCLLQYGHGVYGKVTADLECARRDTCTDAHVEFNLPVQ